jgi:hopanoid biosynthesis associated protein HpnK
MSKKMIINADDFGLCAGVNKAVQDAHSTGALTSATIMAGMPGFDEAVEIAKKMPSLGVGVHLNVVDGRPVSNDLRVKVLTAEDGHFRFKPGRLALQTLISNEILRAIEIELSAQIEAVLENGINPTHLDSHKHFHCFPKVYRIVCRLAEKYKIGAIRWPWEPSTVCSHYWPKVERKDKIRAMLVRNMASYCQKTDSRFIKTDMFFGLAHTGRIDNNFWSEIVAIQYSGVAEVMTHPGYSQGLVNTRLVKEREVELRWLCGATKKLFEDANIELVHFGNITEDKNVTN